MDYTGSIVFNHTCTCNSCSPFAFVACESAPTILGQWKRLMERNIGWRGGGRKRSGWMGRGEKEGRDRTTRKEREWEKVKGKINENIAREVGNVQIRILTRISNSCLQVHSTCTYRFHVQVYSGTSHCGHLWNKDTFLIWTLAFVPIVAKKLPWIKDTSTIRTVRWFPMVSTI